MFIQLVFITIRPFSVFHGAASPVLMTPIHVQGTRPGVWPGRSLEATSGATQVFNLCWHFLPNLTCMTMGAVLKGLAFVHEIVANGLTTKIGTDGIQIVLVPILTTSA